MHMNACINMVTMHFSGDVSLLGVGLHFKFLAALAPGEWLLSDYSFYFLIQVSQNHLTPNSDFSPDFAHIFWKY